MQNQNPLPVSIRSLRSLVHRRYLCFEPASISECRFFVRSENRHHMVRTLVEALHLLLARVFRVTVRDGGECMRGEVVTFIFPMSSLCISTPLREFSS